MTFEIDPFFVELNKFDPQARPEQKMHAFKTLTLGTADMENLRLVPLHTQVNDEGRRWILDKDATLGQWHAMNGRGNGSRRIMIVKSGLTMRERRLGFVRGHNTD